VNADTAIVVCVILVSFMCLGAICLDFLWNRALRDMKKFRREVSGQRTNLSNGADSKSPDTFVRGHSADLNLLDFERINKKEKTARSIVPSNTKY
jgi:hypothetical protein